MPPTFEDRLQDILEAIGEIQGLLQGVGFDQFTSDRHKRLMTERLLEIVCEASRTFPGSGLSLDSGVLMWRVNGAILEGNYYD
jgi:uncharacterized protein with HEPN domain